MCSVFVSTSWRDCWISAGLTVDVDESSNLVLVVGQTSDLSHRQRGVSGDCQPVDHCREHKMFSSVFSQHELILLNINVSHRSLYPWRQRGSSWAALSKPLFLQNANKHVDNTHQLVCKQQRQGGAELLQQPATPELLYCDSVLTGVAVVLFVALQLEVFVPHTQLLTGRDPHTQTLQHQQTLRRHTEGSAIWSF